MDALDLRILRELFPGKEYSLTGIDPRFTHSALARATGMSRLTLRRRFRRWQTSGLWSPPMIYPHPSEFRAAFQMQAFRLAGSRATQSFNSAANRFLAPVQRFQTNDIYVVLNLTASRAIERSRQHAIATVHGVGVLGPPHLVRFPEESRPMGPYEWTVLRELRRWGADWARLGRVLGRRPGEVRRKVGAMMARRQVFVFPSLDFRRSRATVALLVAFLSRPGSRDDLLRTVREHHPDTLPIEDVFPMEVILPPALRHHVADSCPFFLSTRSIAEADRVRLELAAVPGVVETIVTFPVRNFETPETWDSAIAGLPAVARPEAGGSPPRGARSGSPSFGSKSSREARRKRRTI